MSQKIWELDLRHQAVVKLVPREYRTRVMVKRLLVHVVRIGKHTGVVEPVVLDLPRLKLMPTGRGVKKWFPSESLRIVGEDSGTSTWDLPEDASESSGWALPINEPGDYRCSSEGSLNEPCTIVVRVPEEGPPTLYQSEEEAIVAFALPLLVEGTETEKDLGVFLHSTGSSELVRARVMLAGDRWSGQGLPPLSGTLKQIAWVSDLRDQLVGQIKLAESGKGSEKKRMEELLSSSRIHSFGRVYESEDLPTFKELWEELQHTVDSDAWLRCRTNLLRWLGLRAVDRRKKASAPHPF